ncbi:protein SOB FIVE-LIKE 5-like isoform X2 [Vicia villosa]|uniref:protein SOB FIVE-LIKE 5-like isoform X2 n=1 Tax=Vicia villosa TaxID=3911 RepID=UPI00273C5373|nr:protein SOB FIVE-LIKE 5-like isoform X2 [Vicia villosa]
MNMSAFDSECSSGCESGWTLYFEHSYGSEGYYGKYKDKRVITNDENYSQDLSMLSDASSGPPHVAYDDDGDNGYFNEKHNGNSLVKQKKNKSEAKKQKVRENVGEDQQNLSSFLHDTASSHVFDFSTNNVIETNQQNYSQGFSATNYFEGTSSYQEEQFGFLQQSQSENELQGNKWYGRKKGFGMR